MGESEIKGGFVCITRDLIDKIAVTNPETLFLYFIRHARWQKEPSRKGLRRGQLYFNIARSADNWGIGRRTLHRWLRVTSEEGWVVTSRQRCGLVVTVCKYSLYQDAMGKWWRDCGTSRGTSGGTSGGTSQITEQENKETKRTRSPPLSDSQGESVGSADGGGCVDSHSDGNEDGRSDATPQDIVAAWNAMARDHPRIKPISFLTESRKRKCQTRLRDPAWAENWRLAIPLVDFDRDDFDWRPDFNWFIGNDENIWKLIEGKYTRNGRPKQKERLW